MFNVYTSLSLNTLRVISMDSNTKLTISRCIYRCLLRANRTDCIRIRVYIMLVSACNVMRATHESLKAIPNQLQERLGWPSLIATR